MHVFIPCIRLVANVDSDQSDRRTARRIPRDDVGGAVRAAVRQHETFESLRPACRQNAIQAAFDVALLIVREDRHRPDRSAGRVRRGDEHLVVRHGAIPSKVSRSSTQSRARTCAWRDAAHLAPTGHDATRPTSALIRHTPRSTKYARRAGPREKAHSRGRCGCRRYRSLGCRAQSDAATRPPHEQPSRHPASRDPPLADHECLQADGRRDRACQRKRTARCRASRSRSLERANRAPG